MLHIRLKKTMIDKTEKMISKFDQLKLTII